MADTDENYFLIVITIIVTILIFLANVYLIIYFQHPDDRTQAYLPKAVVLLGLSFSMIAILMLPLDVSNRTSCDDDALLSECDLTLPMEELWYAVYIIIAALVTFIIPFTMFYYEADVDSSITKKISSGAVYGGAVVVILSLVLGIGYGVAGFVDFKVTTLTSATVPLASLSSTNETCTLPFNTTMLATSPGFDDAAPAIFCDAMESSNWPPWYDGSETISVRPTFPVYVIAIFTLIGWVLFFIFAGVGIVALPIDAIFAFFYRPRATITKSEYIKEATGLAKRAGEIQTLAQALRKEERANGRTRLWRQEVIKLNQELVALEEDEQLLRDSFPQGEDRDTAWAWTVVTYLLSLIGGLVGIIISVCWIVHIILYIFNDPPASPFLNDFFSSLDDSWGLLGTLAFAIFCFYLVLAVIKGNIKFGRLFPVFSIYPIRAGATLMSSFLFNLILILLSTTAIIQFCADAFELYVNETAINQIFTNEIENLRGLGGVYKENVFIFAFFSISSLTLLSYAFCCCNPSRRRIRK